MRIIALEGLFSICKTRGLNNIEQYGKPCFIGVTDSENSVLCLSVFAPDECISREDGWCGFKIDGQLDFSLIGVLSGISEILAGQKIGILALSTYDTDYVFVKEENFNRALNSLESSGYEVVR